jgi:hypothetical protein
MRSKAPLASLALAAILAAGCGGTPSSAPSPSPAPPTSSPVATQAPLASVVPTPTGAPTVAPLEWGAILGDRFVFGIFTVTIDPEYNSNVLVVQRNGGTVGLVYVDTQSAADFTFDVTGSSGLARVATDFVETARVDRTTLDQAGTFTPMPVTDVAFGARRGFRSGFAWKDHLGVLERWVEYVAAAPGGIVMVSANALPASTPGRGSFNDDATLVSFFPVLDQIVAALRWPTP